MTRTSLNEINTLLDLVSWLLSARSKVAQTTMSPALKGGVPVGSAEMKTVPTPELSRFAQQKLNDTSNIVRLRAFEKCSDKLLAASTRLKTEAEHQSKYWDQMAEIRSKGWPVSRLPRDSRTLVAHVAATEAAPSFRNKGLIPFRRDENGDLTIPSIDGASAQRRLAVLVRRQGNTTGFYQSEVVSKSSLSTLENSLIQAKERIFEEELFSEASREAQLITSMGAQVRSNSIEIEVTPEHAVSITYLPITSKQAISEHEDDDIAAFIGNNLRTMLIAEHEARHRTRSQRPPNPMVPNPNPSPEYILIRPIIAQLRHHINALPILQDLNAYQISLRTAGLQFLLDAGDGRQDDPTASALQSLRQITTTLIKLSLPSNAPVELSIETQLAPPRFGTQYRSTKYRSSCGSRILQPTSSSKVATAFADDVIARDVCQTIVHSEPDGARWKVQTDQPLELVLVKKDKPQALLAASCHAGSLAVSFLNTKTKVVKRVVYDRTEAKLTNDAIGGAVIDRPLNAVIAEWTARALSSTPEDG